MQCAGDLANTLCQVPNYTLKATEKVCIVNSFEQTGAKSKSSFQNLVVTEWKEARFSLTVGQIVKFSH